MVSVLKEKKYEFVLVVELGLTGLEQEKGDLVNY